jgi:hypothetical protein
MRPKKHKSTGSIMVFGSRTDCRLRIGLLNAVQPTGNRSHRKSNVVVPLGAAEKAQLGLQRLQDAVLELAKANPTGVTNAEICHALSLHSNHGGGSKNFNGPNVT